MHLIALLPKRKVLWWRDDFMDFRRRGAVVWGCHVLIVARCGRGPLRVAGRLLRRLGLLAWGVFSHVDDSVVHHTTKAQGHTARRVVGNALICRRRRRWAVVMLAGGRFGGRGQVHGIVVYGSVGGIDKIALEAGGVSCGRL